MALVKKKKPAGGDAGSMTEHRRGNRAKAVIPIGVRVGGRPLTAGCTLNVGEGGALLICSEDLDIGTEMQVTNLKSDEFFTCRVVRRAGFHESGRFGLGVEILNPDRETADGALGGRAAPEEAPLAARRSPGTPLRGGSSFRVPFPGAWPSLGRRSP